jgi:hypothetical protein
VNSANRASNDRVCSPVVSQPESRTARTASFSRSVIEGRANGRNGASVDMAEPMVRHARPPIVRVIRVRPERAQ